MHAGSLLSALVSYLDARAHNGSWLVRIEDIDPYRSRRDAADSILATLEYFGLYWDGPVLFQSQQLDRYQGILEKLDRKQLTYPCNCSRKTLKSLAQDGVYPGLCRHRAHCPRDKASFAVRMLVPDCHFGFRDRLAGPFSQNLAREVGDFILKRRDGAFAYQLAVVADDALQQITHVVRGMDLLDNTPRQLYLQQQLELPSPVYLHSPLLVDHNRQKLSKQQGTPGVSRHTPGKTLYTLLTLINHHPPQELDGASVREILEWAVSNWQPEKISAQQRGIHWPA